MEPVNYWINERGHREFTVSGRGYRAFWMELGHYWSLIEVGLDGLKIAPEPPRMSWQQKNWAAVESFVIWRAKLEQGIDLSGLKIVARKAGRKKAAA